MPAPLQPAPESAEVIAFFATPPVADSTYNLRLITDAAEQRDVLRIAAAEDERAWGGDAA
jgi:hypothetical protein